MERIESGTDADAAKPARKVIPVATGKAILIGLLLGLVLAGGIVALLKFGKFRAPSRVVPDVIGQSLASAKSMISAAKLRPVVEYDPSSKRLSGTVIKVMPPVNARVKNGSTVTIIIAGKPKPTSSGTKPNPPPANQNTHTQPVQPANSNLTPPAPAKVAVPDVAEMTEARAKAELKKAGLDVEVQPGDPSAQAGVVTAVAPAVGTDVEKGATVTITVSTPLVPVKPAAIKLDNYVGAVGKDAVAALRRLGLVVRLDFKSTKIQPDGYVLETKPAAGAQLQAGNEVILVLAKP